MKGLLVDTNVVVWMLLGDRDRVTRVATDALEDERHPILVSAASVWEIAIKRSLGKLRIEDGWARALGRVGLEPLPITAIHASEVERLPWHHRDPFDRLLIAQATVEELPMVTADPQLSAYGVEIVW